MDTQLKTVGVSDPLPKYSQPASERSVDLAFSPSGENFVVTGYGKRALIIDQMTLKSLTKLENSPSGMDVSVCISSDFRLFTGCSDGTICQWDIISGKLLRQWKAYAEEVAGIAIHPSGKWIISSSAKELKIWSSDGNRERCYFPLPNALEWLRFSKDGKIMFQSGEKMALEGWDLE